MLIGYARVSKADGSQPRPEQHGAVPHIDSGILSHMPRDRAQAWNPLCTGRGASSYAVNEESPSPIGPGALQAPGRAALPPGEAARAGAADPGPLT